MPISSNSLLTSHGHTCFQDATRAADAANAAISYVTRDSDIITQRKVNRFPRFDRDEIDLGNLLGSGGFSDVYEIRSITIRGEGGGQLRDLMKLNGGAAVANNGVEGDPMNASDRSLVVTEDEFESKKFIAKHCIRESSEDARYAMKFLKGSVMKDKRRYRQGAADLAIEAYFLANIAHPNIVKLRAICSSGVDGFASTKLGGFFIVMDRLYDTLEVRIEKWAQKAKKSKTFFRRLLWNRRLKKDKLFLAFRLNVAFDVAGALNYLHNKHIIYRDLKPENIGFDIRGDVKLFDFGLAKELRQDTKKPDGSYRLSINTGSRRYMAPEVAKGMPYNLAADVYSFAVLLWEMSSMEKPWEEHSYDEHENEVIYGKSRPEIPKNWPFGLSSLIKRSWNDDWNGRPNFKNIVSILKSEVTKLRGGDETGLEHMRRRSTFVRRGDKSRYFSTRHMTNETKRGDEQVAGP